MLLSFALLTAACGVEGRVSKSITATIAKGPGTRVVLTEHTPFAWDRVCVFGPYTPEDRVDALTGIERASRQAHDIQRSENLFVLMFIREGRIVASVALSRADGDFARETADKCYPPELSHFVVRVAAGGRPIISPE